MKIGIITALFTLVILIGGVYLIYEQGKPKEASAATAQLAACLTEKGTKMYGAYWCPHCKSQKEAFGSAVDKISYVECTRETALCLEKKVTGYPTWIFADGSSVSGEQSMETLAQKSGCPYVADGATPKVEVGGESTPVSTP